MIIEEQWEKNIPGDQAFLHKAARMMGETGKIDAAAAHAQAKGLSYIYEGYSDTNCLVEFDGEYEHFNNPYFMYGWRPYTKEEFIKNVDKLKPEQR